MEYRPKHLKVRFEQSFWGGEIYVYNKYGKKIDVIEISDHDKKWMKDKDSNAQHIFNNVCGEWISDNLIDLEDLECR